MNGALGFLETTGLTPSIVAVDHMVKSSPVRVEQIEINDLLGVCVKISGEVVAVSTAIELGQRLAESMNGKPVARVLTRLAQEAKPAVFSPPEYNPLIQQEVVFQAMPDVSQRDNAQDLTMNHENTFALGLIETQGFTAVFEAIDTACKAASVEVVGKEKLGGGYVTVIIKGDLSAVTAAVAAGQEKVGELGKLIAAHVIARPSQAVLSLLPKI